VSIVLYTDRDRPLEEYPRRIISPARPSSCCVEENRERIGGVEQEAGEAYFYKRCRVCGHTVRFFFAPRYKSTAFEAQALRQRGGQTLH
jgi:hypothetical protein